MKKSTVLLIAFLCSAVTVFATEEKTLPAEKFLYWVRSRSASQNSFADLTGTLTHLKRNQGGAARYSIRFQIRFGKEKVQAKLLLNNSEQHYFEQKHNDKAASTITANVKDGGLLKKLGFRIGDLTMDFLYYPVASEEKTTSYKTLKCRVLVLRSPENKPVKVWIASEYLFPMRAEFYSSFDKLNLSPEKTLEITGFEKVGDYYVASDIALLSKEFRSRIAFKDCFAVRSDDPKAVEAFKE